MKAIRIFQYVCICAGVLLFPAQGAWAQEGPGAEKIRIGDAYFTRGQIIEDFLSVAFSESMWNQEMDRADYERQLEEFLENYPDLNDASIKKKYEGFKITRPWAADYIYYPHGWPKRGVLSKWENEISIGIDWPPYGRSADIEGAGGNSPYSEGLQSSYPVIQDQIAKLIPDIKAATGLPVRFVMPGDPEDKTERFARIRIVPVRHTELNNAFKTLRYTGYKKGPYDPWSFRENENHLWGGVSFTPSSRTQVDGYILPNSDNSIGLSVCKIAPYVGEDFIRALITECLARALGLPDLSVQSKGGVLGAWNDINAKYSKVPFMDGNEAAVFYERKMQETGKKPEFTIPENIKTFHEFSAYDEYMIALLYCKEVRSGMDKAGLVRVLAEGRCLKKREGE